jgi:cell division protein FtsI (penicillin-binding protein 3)
VIAAFMLLTVVMGGRVVFLHIYEKDFLQGEGDARTVRIDKIPAHRGMILDRLGKPLAISTPVLSLWAKPAELLKTPDNLQILASMLKVPLPTFEEKLERSKGKSFVYIRRHMPPKKARQILDLKIKGVYSEREYKRFYPAGEVAAHVVGYTNVDDKGQEGLELSYDSWLQGEEGKKKVLKNLYGEIIRDLEPISDALPGKNLDLSIDLRLQYLAYRELKNAVSYHQAKSGSVVIVEVETGAILALVNQPSYNPNNRQALELASVRNRAVTDVFEPGSTVKPFTIAVALNSDMFDPTSTIDTSPGFIKVGNKTIPDPRNYGVLDLGGIIEKSSQVGISKLALNLDPASIWSMFSDIGFGHSTGIGFPGERSGYLPNRRRWKDIERVTFAYGYGFQVTPLQLAAAYQVIAASGLKRPLSLVQSAIEAPVRVLDKGIATQLKTMLTRVVTEGTGSRAAINAFSVAGKTGTVRKVGKSGYEDTRHLAFFAGMTPVKNPKLVGVVMINEPKGKEYGGGAIAAPLFSKIMSEALRLMNVAPMVIEEAA